MNCYAIISTVDGLSVAHYETLSQAVEDWIVSMKDGPLKDEVDFAVSQKEFDDLQRDNDRLEDEVRNLEEKVPSKEDKERLEALWDIPDDCLEKTLELVADAYGYHSKEYDALEKFLKA